MEEMTSLSRIIRTSMDDQLTKTIEVRSFSFETELGETKELPTLSAQAILDEQAKVRKQLQLERAQANEEIQQQRERLELELQATREAWLKEKEIMQQQAYDAGFAQGYEEGNLKIQSDLKVKITEVNENVAHAISNGEAYLQSQEQIILELAIESANRIVGRQVSSDPEVFIDIIKRALVEARDAEFIKIYVTSEYYAFITSKREELMTLLPPNLLFTIFIDEKLYGTESYLESNHGRMIISIDSQLKELKKSLLEIMESVD